MIDHLITALYLTVPLVLSGIGHMVVVRANLLSALRRPLDERRLGPNKTVRGIVVMPLLTVLGVYGALRLEAPLGDHLTSHLDGAHPVLLGLSLGLGYVLAELPNSYMKRRLGIEAGKLPAQNKFWFATLDQADSALGCMTVYALWIGPPWQVLLLLVLLGPSVHLAVNVALYLAGLRKEPL